MTAAAAVRPQPVPPAGSAGSGDLPELSFVHPIPGFPGLRRYVLVRLDDGAGGAGGRVKAGPVVAAALEAAEASVFELRSLERPEVRFLTAVPTAFFPDYEIELDETSCDDLGLTDPDDAVVLVILTVGGGPDQQAMAANLLAPVVINSRTRAAGQLILSGSEWPVRALLN